MLLAGALAVAVPPLAASAKDAAGPADVPAATAGPPRLIVAISVDQFSADLFAHYRRHFTQGLARLQDGAVFPSGYQSHAATETCPGHSTILTGVRPARSGIIANDWFDLSIARASKQVYCAEDETNPASSPGNPVVSARHLNAPHAGRPAEGARSCQQERRGVLQGSHGRDDGRPCHRCRLLVASARLRLVRRGEQFPPRWKPRTARRWPRLPRARRQWRCRPGAPAMARPLDAGGTAIGEGRFPLERGKAMGFTISPRMDAAVANLAVALVDEQGLGRDAASDVLTVGLSATDTIGHTVSPGGLEMCIQMAELDKTIGRLLAALDARKLDYMVVLTADHGGFDVVERQREQAYPRAVRGDTGLMVAELAKTATAMTGITAPVGQADLRRWHVWRSLHLAADLAGRPRQGVRCAGRPAQIAPAGRRRVYRARTLRHAAALGLAAGLEPEGPCPRLLRSAAFGRSRRAARPRGDADSRWHARLRRHPWQPLGL